IIKIEEWVSYVVSAGIFMLFWMSIQIKTGIRNMSECVDINGTLSSRFLSIFVDAIFLTFMIGVYNILIIDIIFIACSIAVLSYNKMHILEFFTENTWKVEYMYIFIGTLFLGIGLLSILFKCNDFGILGLKGKIFCGIVVILFTHISLPPNSPLAKFATSNYKNK
ncbi:hypothetical protein CG709_04275, partial [Lachnotalea glycerini]